MRGRLQRKDLPTLVVLATVQVYGYRAWEVLCETYPWKVVYRAMERDNDRGYLNCGTSITRSWIEPKGEVLIRSEKYKAIC